MENRKIQIIVTSLIFIIIAGFFYYNQFAGFSQEETKILVSNKDRIETDIQVTEDAIEAEENITEKEISIEEDATICVHVCGAVKKPGVYTFDKRVRISDVIQAAKGLKKNANDVAINQAEFVQDGMQIYIPFKGEMTAEAEVDKKDSEQTSPANEMEQGKLNINTATLEQLMTLSGIGEGKAKKIIEYREEHGAFQKIEDIMKITGIKDGIFQKIKDAICI